MLFPRKIANDRTSRALEAKTLTTGSNSAAELNTRFGPILSAAFNNAFGFYGAIEHMKMPAGDGVGWRTRTGRNTGVAAIGETENLPASGAQGRVKMKADYKINVATVEITGKMMAEAQASGWDNIDAIDDELINAVVDLTNMLEQHSFSRQTTPDYAKQIFGLPRIVNNVNGQAIYDKTRGAGPELDYLDAALVEDNGGSPRDLTKDIIIDLKGAIWDAVGKEPNMFVTTRVIGDQMEKLWEAESRATPQEFEVNAGFIIKRAYGIPVLKSQHCNPGCLYGIDTDQMKFAYLVQGQLEKLGKVKDADAYFMKNYEELICTNLRGVGVQKDIGIAS